MKQDVEEGIKWKQGKWKNKKQDQVRFSPGTEKSFALFSLFSLFRTEKVKTVKTKKRKESDYDEEEAEKVQCKR